MVKTVEKVMLAESGTLTPFGGCDMMAFFETGKPFAELGAVTWSPTEDGYRGFLYFSEGKEGIEIPDGFHIRIRFVNEKQEEFIGLMQGVQLKEMKFLQLEKATEIRFNKLT